MYRAELIDQLATLRHTAGRRVTETGYAQSHASPLSASSYLLHPISTRVYTPCKRTYVHIHAYLRVCTVLQSRAYHRLPAIRAGDYRSCVTLRTRCNSTLGDMLSGHPSNRLAAYSLHTCSTDAWTATFCIRNRADLGGSTGSAVQEIETKHASDSEGYR